MIRTKYSVFNYLTTVDLDKIWGIYVTGSGYANLPPQTPYPPTKHPDAFMFDWHQGRILQEFQIIYITRGKGIFESKEVGKEHVEEGTIFLLFPGVWHRYKPSPKTGWTEHWISFNGIQPRRLRKFNIISPDRAVLKIGLDERIIKLYKQILEHIESESIGFKETIAALTNQILAQVNAIDKSINLNGNEIKTTLQKAEVYMIDRLDQQINFDALSHELGVGYSWFRKTFHDYTGFSPKQYFLKLKLEKAKELLLNTPLSIKEISVMTGFESQYYFSKFFKKRIGVSPIQLRKISDVK
jgi:AraC-like DNA-binding protein